MKDYQVIVLISGILFSQIFVKILKEIIKQNRPIKSKTYGMPSSRSTVISFIVFYLIFVNKFKLSTKFIIIILVLLSLSIKYIIKEHSIYQLIVGGLLGTTIAYFSSLIKFD